MADRESIRHPELAKAISAFFDTDVEDGPGVLQKRDVSLVYDVGRVAAARDGYEQAPRPVTIAANPSRFIVRRINRTINAGTAGLLGSGSGIEGVPYRVEGLSMTVTTDSAFGAGNLVRVVPSMTPTSGGVAPLAPVIEVEPEVNGITPLIYYSDERYRGLYLSGVTGQNLKGFQFGLTNTGATSVDFTVFLTLKDVSTE